MRRPRVRPRPLAGSLHNSIIINKACRRREAERGPQSYRKKSIPANRPRAGRKAAPFQATSVPALGAEERIKGIGRGARADTF